MRGSSPRTRGYFQYASRVHPYARLFPARAGVFPAFGDIDEPIERSSPRTRGYFRTRANILDLHLLFPAHAGVLRTGAASNQFPNAYLIPTNGSALVWI